MYFWSLKWWFWCKKFEFVCWLCNRRLDYFSRLVIKYMGMNKGCYWTNKCDNCYCLYRINNEWFLFRFWSLLVMQSMTSTYCTYVKTNVKSFLLSKQRILSTNSSAIFSFFCCCLTLAAFGFCHLIVYGEAVTTSWELKKYRIASISCLVFIAQI